ncbi:MAG TPA: hypothetical protein PKJ19_14315, partial [Flavobacteriales bacterium]|nr:hypothetical protein [Flavobacteriales bacterium]
TLLNQVTGAGSNSQTEFQHCVFHNFNFSNSNGNGNVRYVNNVMLKLNTAPFQVNEPSIYEYNLFAGSGGTYNTTFATGIANTGNTSVASIDTAFVANNNINPNAYSITADYHLLPAYQVIGEGGAQPGIYGGADPWKEGQIPFTPHWIELYTPNTNTVNGVLQGVHIKASAQQH